MKIIKDLVHGYVEVFEVEERLINTSNFQRLKDINQLTSQYIYPSATHSRFEHSLGVMHLTKKAFENLKTTFIKEHSVTEQEYEELLFHVSVAALLHDVGHAPFSHLGEKYYRREEIRHKIEGLIDTENLMISKDVFSVGSKHELMSCYIILKRYINIIQDAVAELEITISLDFELICRCIVGKTYNVALKWKENIIVGIVNSNTLDMDKLDYLMRDAAMTGVGVPIIDVTRLFKNIYINPRTKKITFRSQALSVIQNIIDSRDFLYLWVYNHHIGVYTDFITEFYIKHMINNFEKDNQYSDKMNPAEFFSCEAICDNLVANSDLFSKIKSSLRLPEAERSKYSKQICPQLFARAFLKPLWKTIYEYKTFLETHIKDSTLIQELEKKMCDSDYVYRRYIAKEIIKRCGVDSGELFIVPRSNKFYSLNPENVFHVYLGGADKAVGELLPQKDFKKLYNNVAFYVFGEANKLDAITQAFINIVTEGIPHKDDLPKDATNLQWFSAFE